ncbi:Propanediol utilization protein PduA [Caloramator mitchellensis]|uniref:Propanediol utilization protein PduA n=1 Tax=Caloramator mitchellensis TaxID=908809 RepID=A0A0R3JTY8_CALMK|nr:BMC domain-containing protein [Caloramator mitchellensis]KRQ86490.1 Propanediol utilization protein PduA [Caloramator mitchellensis]
MKMKREALGIIETYGFTDFIVAFDIALKSANVKYLSHCFVRAGLVSGYIQGDVSDVEEALQSVKSYFQTFKKNIKIHCIPRPYEDTCNLIEPLCGEKDEVIVIEKKKEIEDDVSMKVEAILGTHFDELKNMKTVDLRKLARQLDSLSIPRDKIKFARKDELIKAIIEFCERKLR